MNHIQVRHPSLPSENPYPPFDHPQRIAEIWVEAWNRRDADRLAELFAEDAEFVNVTGLWWHDREAIRQAHDYGLRTIFDQSTIALVERRVRWLAGGADTTPAVAVVHAKIKLEGQTAVAEVDDPRPRRTIFTFVVRRTDDDWRCVAAQNTDVVPGAETNVIDDQGQMRSVSYRSGPSPAPN
ncbi:YybH family protein [Salinibacter sp.]|uniref:YybH family protein n=1 Tax=Salinibacter sp. TaxID=2065818 RepID=UPI0021E8A460|nr:SgcJ/EcaC family oxidoreductase [Salinibacter sp.]